MFSLLTFILIDDKKLFMFKKMLELVPKIKLTIGTTKTKLKISNTEEKIIRKNKKKNLLFKLDIRNIFFIYSNIDNII